MEKLKAVMVDDESHCLETLQWQLSHYCPNVEVIASFTSSRDALAGIPDLNPDIVFMDIEMPYLNAFDLLQALPKMHFHLIFTTAYNEYALKAFHFSALDYLLKPISKDELVNAVKKAWERNTRFPAYQQMEILMQQMSRKQNMDQKISLPTLEGLEFVPVKEIVRCQSDSNYSNIYLLSGKKLMVSRTLKFLEETLQDHSFLRVHHSHLVNLQHIEKYIRGDGGTLVMADGAEVTVARSRKDILLDACKNLL
jgi:two-component system LytT family response regulator